MQVMKETEDSVVLNVNISNNNENLDHSVPNKENSEYELPPPENEGKEITRGIFDFLSNNSTEDNKESKTEDDKAKLSEANDVKSNNDTSDAVVITVSEEVDKNKKSKKEEKINIPTQFNDFDLYEEEPLLKDIPFDIYDDSINVEPQNPIRTKKGNYQTISPNHPSEMNLYEDTPQTEKTIWQKIKEIFEEAWRLICVFISSIFTFIWALIGGFFISIWLLIQSVFYFFVKNLIKASLRHQQTQMMNQINEIKNSIWDINKMNLTIGK